MKFNNLIKAALFFGIFSLTFFLTKEQNKIAIEDNKKVKVKSSPEEKLQTIKDRDEYMFQLMRDPKTNSIPKNIRAREIEFAKTLSQKFNSTLMKTNREDFDWEEVGPNDVGGRTRALAIDVNNSNRVLAGGVSGGIWETMNRGTSWEFISSSTSLLSVTSIVQDPRDGHTDTWYFSAGEFSGNSASATGAPFRGNGIYKSIDNGLTWNLLLNTESSFATFDPRYDYVSKIIINPTTGSIFIASNATGILKSTDGGSSFSIKLGEEYDHHYCDIVVSADGTLIASISQSGFNASQINSPGIYRSTDDGENWEDITPVDFPATHERSVLAIAESNTNIVYVLTNTGEYNGDDEIVNLFRLDNSDLTFEDLSTNLPTFSTFRGSFTAQSNYDLTIAVKPDDEDFVVLGSVSLFRSTDGLSAKLDDSKLDWIGGYAPSGSFFNHHPDQHILVFDKKEPNGLWSGHDGGLSYTPDITNTSYSSNFPWENKNNGYNVTQFYAVSIAKDADDTRIMGGTQDNGTPHFRYSAGNTTSSDDKSSGDGSYSYYASSHAYVSTQNGSILRVAYKENGDPYNAFVDDGNLSQWATIHPKSATGQLFINPFVINPNLEKHMFYPAGDTLWRNVALTNLPLNEDGGTDLFWFYVADVEGYNITALDISISNPEHLLYYGASNSNQLPKIFKLNNASDNPLTDVPVEISIPDAEPGSRVVDIAINPEDGNEILIVMSNYSIIGLYHSIDAGVNFAAVEGNLEGDGTNPGPSLRTATILPYNGDTYYFVGTSTGLYSTVLLNGGTTSWVQESPTGLGNVIVQQLASRTSDNVVVAATHGRGMFKGKPNGITGGVNNQSNLLGDFKLAQNYPNPFNPSTVIKYAIPSNSKVSLIVYDLLGKEVLTLVNGEKASGSYEVNFDAKNLASGIYYYSLKAGNFTETKKMILLQ